MIGLGIFLLFIGIIAYALGAGGVAGLTIELGKWLLIIGIVLFLIFGVLGYSTGHVHVFSW